MKLQILQENLEKAVSTTSRFASSRAQLPVLGNILISTHKSKVCISSTNLEISASVQVGAKIEEEGEISVPAKVISELVANLPKETVTLTSEKEQLKVSVSNFASTVLGMNSADFPKIPSMNIMALAKALAPKAKIKFTGIRPGEKLHEVLLPPSDARHSLEFDKFFIIEPEFDFWGHRASKLTGGKTVSEDFESNSLTNPPMLSVDDMRKKLISLGYDLGDCRPNAKCKTRKGT